MLENLNLAAWGGGGAPRGEQAFQEHPLQIRKCTFPLSFAPCQSNHWWRGDSRGRRGKWDLMRSDSGSEGQLGGYAGMGRGSGPGWHLQASPSSAPDCQVDAQGLR